MLAVLTLKNEKTYEYYDILRKKTHLVARSGFSGDLEISDDTSVSRSHAEISLVKQVVRENVKLCLNVIDKESKFGTFVNEGIIQNERIKSDVPIILELGDKIRFGAMNSTWIVENYLIVACPSTLKMVDKVTLKNSVMNIGGQITRDWSEQCTHLCMNSITVTEKVLLCLASAKSIVPVKYFTDLCEALSPDSLTEIPFCIDYKPNLVENILNPNSVSMDVNNKRKTLFSGKTFICSTNEQLNRISKIVKAAGGELMNYADCLLNDINILNHKEYIIMQRDQYNTENNDRYQLILEKLKMAKKRPIPENDIGLAIIFSSTSKHCNPNYNISLVNLQSQHNEIESQTSVVLAPETEVLTIENSEISSVNVISDSLAPTQACIKRPLEVIMDTDEIIIPRKRVFSLKDEETKNIMKMKTDENDKPSKKLIESIPSQSNKTFQFLDSKLTVMDAMSTNNDSYLTIVPCSQETSSISKKKDLTTCLQPNFANNSSKYINEMNNVHSDTRSVCSKRKYPSVDDEDDEDPFNYMDIDEIEDNSKTKPKNEYKESIFHSMLAHVPSNSKQSKSVEPKTNEAIDPNFVMNLLATAKGTGKFIDTSKQSDKSSVNMDEDSENDDLLNSVVVKTVKLVVSKPTLTPYYVIQGSSNLKNFKKFKRKGPAMRIPNIVPLELYESN